MKDMRHELSGRTPSEGRYCTVEDEEEVEEEEVL
jgi:hypothetical protein